LIKESPIFSLSLSLGNLLNTRGGWVCGCVCDWVCDWVCDGPRVGESKQASKIFVDSNNLCQCLNWKSLRLRTEQPSVSAVDFSAVLFLFFCFTDSIIWTPARCCRFKTCVQTSSYVGQYAGGRSIFKWFDMISSHFFLNSSHNFRLQYSAQIADANQPSTCQP